MKYNLFKILICMFGICFAEGDKKEGDKEKKEGDKKETEKKEAPKEKK